MKVPRETIKRISFFCNITGLISARQISQPKNGYFLLKNVCSTTVTCCSLYSSLVVSSLADINLYEDVPAMEELPESLKKSIGHCKFLQKTNSQFVHGPEPNTMGNHPAMSGKEEVLKKMSLAFTLEAK